MNVEIEINLIARTAVIYSELGTWLRQLGVSEETIAQLTTAENSDASILTACAAKQCYMSFEAGLNPNVTKTRSDMAEYLDNVMAQGHGSVLEHVYFTFAINNVSRVFTGEMNRHRAGVAISERSMRYIRFEEDIKWWMPSSIRLNDYDDEDIVRRKLATQEVFIRAFKQMQENYAELCYLWDMDEAHHNFHYKKTMTSCFRRIIGMGAATGGVWTFNVRALRHMLTMRCSKAAEEEIQLVATGMLAIMQAQEPVLFGDFKDGKPKHVKV